MVALCGAVACGDPTGAEREPDVAAVPDSLALQAVIGGNAWAEGPARDSLGAPPGVAVSFAIADPAVATVDSLGRVEGRRAGRTVLTATVPGRRVALPVVVRAVRYAAAYPGSVSPQEGGYALTTEGELLGWGSVPLNRETSVTCAPSGSRDGGTVCGPARSDAPTFVGTRLRFRSFSFDHLERACGLTLDGAVVCWALYGRCDQVAHGRCAFAFDTIHGARPYQALNVGYGTVCALTEDGTAECWGDNGYGNAGVGVRGPVTVPTPVRGGVRFQSLVSAQWRTCGLAVDGTAWCWGLLEPQFDRAREEWAPVLVAGGTRFTSISAEQCGLTTTGTVECWAADPLAPAVSPPRLVALSGFCGRTADGDGLCWQPGLSGAFPVAARPATTLGIPGFLARIEASSSLSGSTACGVTTEGAAYCRGDYPAEYPAANALGRVPGNG